MAAQTRARRTQPATHLRRCTFWRSCASSSARLASWRRSSSLEAGAARLSFDTARPAPAALPAKGMPRLAALTACAALPSPIMELSTANSPSLPVRCSSSCWAACRSSRASATAASALSRRRCLPLRLRFALPSRVPPPGSRPSPAPRLRGAPARACCMPCWRLPRPWPKPLNPILASSCSHAKETP